MRPGGAGARASTPEASANFAYLAHHDVRLVALGTQAEEHFAGDPSVTLFKLRQFGELLAKRAAAKVGMFVEDNERQIDLINRLHDRGVISIQQRTLLHDLRKVGNTAVHEGHADHAEALHQLKMARELGVWFQRAFGNNRKFDPGPFVPPPKPKRASVPPAQREALEKELADLRERAEERDATAVAAAREAERIRLELEAQILARMSAEDRAAKAEDERQIWEALAAEVADDLTNVQYRRLAVRRPNLLGKLVAKADKPEDAVPFADPLEMPPSNPLRGPLIFGRTGSAIAKADAAFADLGRSLTVHRMRSSTDATCAVRHRMSRSAHSPGSSEQRS